ncbi:MAG: AsmA family protein [Gammaproteobacteria bacterium]
MKKFLKIIFVLLLLLVLAVSVFVYMFDANKYKHELAELAQSYTGRPIVLNGDVKLSLYPWIGVQLQNVTIGNKAGFSKKDFASIERFDISVKILPLLLKRLEIDELVVHRLVADFELNAAGENNWSELIGGSENPDTESGLNGFYISGIEVTDSRLSWLDANTGKRFNLSAVNITTEAFVEGQPLPLTFKAYIQSNQPEWRASTSVKTKLAFDPGSPIFDARDLKLAIKAQLPIEDMDPVIFYMLANSRVNVKTKTISLDNAKLSFLDLVMSGTFDVENIFSIPTIQGPLRVKKFEASTLAKHFKVDLPELANQKSLKDISLTAKFKTDFDSIYLDDLSAKVDNSQVKGFIRITELSETAPVVRYELDVDKMIWKDYMFANSKSRGSQSKHNELLLPLGFIRSVDLEGRLDVATVMLDDLSVSSLHVPSNIKKGVLTFNPITMAINDAKVKAAMEVRASKVPVARASIKINNLNATDSINPLFSKVMGEKPLLMEGIVTVSANLKSTGKSIPAHRSSLTGVLEVNMDNLVLQGVDLNNASRQVVADYANRNEFRTRRSYVPSHDPDSRNDFTSLAGTFKLSGNKISTTDILLVSDAVTISGAGSIDFQNNTLNYRSVIDTHVKERIDIRDKLLDYPMEYGVKGTFGSITTQFDLDKYDLRVGRLLMIEAKARKIRAIKNKGNNTW